MRQSRGKRNAVAAVAALLFILNARIATAAENTDLTRLSLEDLGNIDITSVSKTSEPLSDAPAAIYVITHEDVIRSGATSIAEILRLAPNLEVAQVSTNTYAISARGFNGVNANKLLVLIDGRTVYTPLYSGVFWDQQYVLPEDIDRIEVISGAGATLWGANAVNGVINIITRNSSDTIGGFVNMAAGNIDRDGSVRYGGKIGDNVTYRAYGEGFDMRSSHFQSGMSAMDSWSRYQGGFRADWRPEGDDLVTLQGDAYHGSEEELTPPHAVIGGQNLLGRWNHRLDNGSALKVQAYYDYNTVYLPGPGNLGDSITTFDLDIQHSFALSERHVIVWGGGYRASIDQFANTASVIFNPGARTLQSANAFVQDSISVTDAVKLILGVKLEDDAYVRPQLLPSARVSWKVTNTDLLWAAISRAVRAPSREDRDLIEKAGTFAVLSGGNFQSEKLIAYEAGYRTQLSSRASLSVSTFYNDYNDLRSIEFSPGPSFPITFENMMAGNTYGVELWGSYRVFDWWRLSAGYNWMHENLRFKSGSSTLGGTQAAGDDPAYQFSLRSSVNIGPDVTFDAFLRGVDALPNPAVPRYIELNARLAWNVTHALELSLSGFNLLHPHHIEFTQTPANVEVPRSYMFNAKYRF